MNFINEESKTYLKKEDNIVAEVDYEKVNDHTYDIYHTFVDESLRGQGLARKLVEDAVNYIESQNYNVTASCSYAKKVLQKNKK